MNNYRKDSRKDEKRSYGEINENLLTKKKISSYRKGLPLTQKKKKNAYKKRTTNSTTSDR